MGNKSQAAGILIIISGAIGLLSSLFTPAMIPMMKEIMSDPGVWEGTMTAAQIDSFVEFMGTFMIVMALIGIALSILAILGGVYAMRRRAWGLALAGSIASILLFFPTGIPAVVFTALSRSEFENDATNAVIKTGGSA
ncbi:hypothetical protein ABFB09_00735 [Dehalogenimonas sp. THU2]|uniref:hypothetical protein n=1 Tax=Dehalogenimonas sp. THU2 TaxID=3151121 RepID=UPI0032183CA0